MLEVRGVTVTIDGAPILRNVDLAVGLAEVVVVLGPSGSGKTTLLRTIAALQEADSGTVAWNGADLDGVPPHRRGFGLMFQDLALFPHRSVAGNVAFGLEMAGATDTRHAVNTALRLVGLEGMGERSIDTLSGGEQQRVALARSLAPQPRLLMLDEPLGSLDRVLRERLAAELRTIFDGLDTAVLYVTHDQDEALALADRVVILNEGRVVQTGTPQSVWLRPVSEFVARFLGWSAFVEVEAGAGSATTPWGRVSTAVTGPAMAALRPGSAAIDSSGQLRATVTAVTFTGEAFAVTLQPPEGPAVQAIATAPPAIGAVVPWQADPAGIIVLASR
jgi:thiamine transport system ATP-binding protein